MAHDLKDFWQRLQSGVEVAVANPSMDREDRSDRLLGVRDGFYRFLRDGYDRHLTVVVVPQIVEETPSGLATSDDEVLGLLGERTAKMQRLLGEQYHFYAATEGGLHSLTIDGEPRLFVHNWTSIRSRIGQAWGASGSVQLPDRIVAGLDNDQIRFSVPGTRKAGGLIASLTGGFETRRQTIALSTFHALSTLFYGLIEGHPRG
jgi:non-canonical (house-cleaning) NTP pyrophosphatase